MPRSNNNGVWTLIGISLPALVVAYLTFARSAEYGFTLDDQASVVKNPDVVDPSVPWTNALTNDFWGNPLSGGKSHQSYRPLTIWTYRLDRWRGNLVADFRLKDKPALAPGPWEDPNGAARVFHETNIALHALASALLALVCRLRLSSTAKQALWTGVFFAVHPVHVEAVASITGRGEILGVFFVLLAFGILPTEMKNKNKRSFQIACFLSCSCLVAAALCKETALPLALTLLLAKLWTDNPPRTMKFPNSGKDVLFGVTCVSIAIVFAWRSMAGAGSATPVTAFEYIGAPLRFEGSLNNVDTSVMEPISSPILMPWEPDRNHFYTFHEDTKELSSFVIPSVPSARSVVLGPSVLTKLLTSAELVAIYLYKMIVAPFQKGRVYAYDYCWPAWTPLRSVHDDDSNSSRRIWNALCLLLPVALIVLFALKMSFRQSSCLSTVFWIAWLGLSLVLPSQLIIKIGLTHADRLAYSGSAAVCALLSSCLFPARRNRSSRKAGLAVSVPIALAGLIVVLWATSAYQHAEDWRRNDVLYLSAMNSPGRMSARVWFNAAGALDYRSKRLYENESTRPIGCEWKMKAARLLEQTTTIGPSDASAFRGALDHSASCGKWKQFVALGEKALTTTDCASPFTIPIAHSCMHNLIETANEFIRIFHQIPAEFRPETNNAQAYGARLDALLVFKFNHEQGTNIIERSVLLQPGGLLPSWRGNVNGVNEICLVRGMDCPKWERGFFDIGLA